MASQAEDLRLKLKNAKARYSNRGKLLKTFSDRLLSGNAGTRLVLNEEGVIDVCLDNNPSHASIKTKRRVTKRF